ncbi:hypothetical protein BpHYR1_053075 [Brachionus plicatilis]|uniref:Uncharacterized protein n=1 Tax=Brachionus plicatilis TaxID=10195 RepID=A0A3M7PWB6_BRAPC|nr:hypothetical protein BpHYR1_053075 [Brachionus plicatilis]
MTATFEFLINFVVIHGFLADEEYFINDCWNFCLLNELIIAVRYSFAYFDLKLLNLEETLLFIMILKERKINFSLFNELIIEILIKLDNNRNFLNG